MFFSGYVWILNIKAAPLEASKPPMKTTAQVTRRISGSLVQETSREEIQAALHPEELVKSIVPGNGGLVASDSKIVASVLAANNLNSTGSDDGLTDKQRTLGRAQFLAICWALFLSGWTDGSTGPLLPRIQAVYKVRIPSFPPHLSLIHLTRYYRLISRSCR